MRQLNHFDRIYAYAEGQMDAEQKAAFEAELSANEELRAEYEAFLASQKALEYLAFDELGDLAKEEERMSAKVIPLWRRTWAIAATVLLLLSAGMLWYANTAYSNERLASEFYVEPNFSPNRGSSVESMVEKAALAFETGRFEEAIDAAAAVSADSLGYLKAQHIFGHAYFKMGQYGSAVTHFANVTGGEYVDNAAFMRGYSLLLSGQEEEGRKLLNEIALEKNNVYSEKAKTLLTKTKGPWRKLVF